MNSRSGTPVDLELARQAVAAERTRIEAALAELDAGVRGEGELHRQQAGDTRESGTDLAAETVAMAVRDLLRGRLDEADRAAVRIDAGSYGRSVESGDLIPPERLAADPLAERTVEEQAAQDRGAA